MTCDNSLAKFSEMTLLRNDSNNAAMTNIKSSESSPSGVS